MKKIYKNGGGVLTHCIISHYSWKLVCFRLELLSGPLDIIVKRLVFLLTYFALLGILIDLT